MKSVFSGKEWRDFLKFNDFYKDAIFGEKALISSPLLISTFVQKSVCSSRHHPMSLPLQKILKKFYRAKIEWLARFYLFSSKKRIVHSLRTILRSISFGYNKKWVIHTPNVNTPRVKIFMETNCAGVGFMKIFGSIR